MSDFNPNRMSLASCMARIEELQARAGVSEKSIITSQDEEVRKIKEEGKVKNIPDGFSKYQLPVFLDKASTMYISKGEPNAKVPVHSHDEGDGIRFIMDGSIRYGKLELKQGDWMFMKAGSKYSFEVGPRGVLMCYCYCCCCA